MMQTNVNIEKNIKELSQFSEKSNLKKKDEVIYCRFIEKNKLKIKKIALEYMKNMIVREETIAMFKALILDILKTFLKNTSNRGIIGITFNLIK